MDGVVRSLLAAGSAARLTRLIVADDLGQWWVKDPLDRAASRWYDQQVMHAEMRGETDPVIEQPWWWKYRSGLDCPFCIGFWVCLAVLALDRSGSRWWRFTASALTLNYITAHIGSRLGDVAPDEEETR